MGKFRLILTRDLTESVVVEVEAESEDSIEWPVSIPDDVKWEIDDGSWDHSDMYITGCEPVEGD